MALVGDLAKIKNILWHFEIFVKTQDHMGLEISKRYSSYSFDSIWAKLYDKY